MTEKTSLQEHYSDNILMKANRLVKMDRVERDEEDRNLFRVKGSKVYKVRRIELGEDEDGEAVDDGGMPFVTCDCPNGLARGGRPNCYHSCSVILILQQEAAEHGSGSNDPSELADDDLPGMWSRSDFL